MKKSFSQEVKDEIIANMPDNDCCAFASLCAIIHTVGSLEISRKGLTFSISTDNDNLLEYMFSVLKRFYGASEEEYDKIYKQHMKLTRKEVKFPVELGQKVLLDCGIIMLNGEGGFSIIRGIDHHMIMEECCKRTYLASSFVGSGTISIPQEDKNSGYHLEWVFSNEEQATDVAELLAEFGWFPKKIQRQERYVVYVKESDSMSDIIGELGARKMLLKLQSEKATRDMRNQINRQANCISANIDKSVESSLKQVAQIEVIKKTIGLKAIPESLQQMAELRLKNKQSSLAELAQLSKLPKTTVRYRLNCIDKIAKELNGN